MGGMINIVLFQPEIPPNTGNIIRLSANTGAHLHLVRPLGFSLDDRSLARAGLDYHDLARVSIHADLDACMQALPGVRVLPFSTRGTKRYDTIDFTDQDALLFGSETAGLPQPVLERFPAEHRLKIPMVAGNRSLNLSNAVAAVVYEVWRQHEFAGCVR